MELNCPNCGYLMFDVKVKTEHSAPNILPQLTVVSSGARDNNPIEVKHSRLADTQCMQDGELTTAEIVQIQELRSRGNSYARIRQMIGKKVSLNQVMAVTKKPQ